MLSKKEIAKEFNISLPTINRYMKMGMPFYKVGGKLVRFYPEEVKKWLIEKREKGE